MASLAFSVVRSAVQKALKFPDPGTRYFAMACAGALAAIIVHSLADFNLYIPANAMLLAWIAGIPAGLRSNGLSTADERLTAEDVAIPLFQSPIAQSAIVNQELQEAAVKYLCLFIVMMTTVSLMAADPVGRVTSSGPLTLNGKAVPVTAVSSLPLVAGDEIATSGSSATIYFSDRSRATLDPNSRVKLEVAELFGGTAGFVRVGRFEAGERLARQLDSTAASGGAERGRGPSNRTERHPTCQRRKSSTAARAAAATFPTAAANPAATTSAKSSLPAGSSALRLGPTQYRDAMLDIGPHWRRHRYNALRFLIWRITSSLDPPAFEKIHHRESVLD